MQSYTTRNSFILVTDYIYTVNHKKTCHFVLIITMAFLGRFLYFLYQWKQEGILYKEVNKIYHFTLTVSPHYLVKLKMTYKQHILKSIITVRSIELVVHKFRRKSYNIYNFIHHK